MEKPKRKMKLASFDLRADKQRDAGPFSRSLFNLNENEEHIMFRPTLRRIPSERIYSPVSDSLLILLSLGCFFKHAKAAPLFKILT